MAHVQVICMKTDVVLTLSVAEAEALAGWLADTVSGRGPVRETLSEILQALQDKVGIFDITELTPNAAGHGIDLKTESAVVAA